MALGEWFAALQQDQQIQFVLCSPDLRVREAASLLVQAVGSGGEAAKLRIDERPHEKEFGILDRLTKLGIQQKHAELNQQRLHVGKFYFRPPGGVSWCDVILRLRTCWKW